MNYLQLAIIVALSAFCFNLWKKAEHAAQERGLAIAAKQISDTALEAQYDSAREVKALIAKRPGRAAELAKVQAQRKVDEAHERKTNPEYGDWAGRPVPQSVVNRLRESARAANSVRIGTDDGAAGAVVRPESAGTAGNDGRRRLGPLRSNGS